MLDKEKLLLYAITDRNCIGNKTLYDAVESALKGGIRIIQLREKNMTDEELIAQAVSIKDLCHNYDALLIINDNYKVAVKAGADGVHVGIDDDSVSDIRKAVGKDFIIGATAKTVEQALTAQSEGADYIGVGAVFPSPTKNTALRISLGTLREICDSVSIPAVAIGGITKDNAVQLKGSGAVGAAVVSAVFAADNITAEAAELKKLCTEVFE